MLQAQLQDAAHSLASVSATADVTFEIPDFAGTARVIADLISGQTSQSRFTMWLMGVFAAVAGVIHRLWFRPVVTVAAAGLGTPSHLAAELLRQTAAIELPTPLGAYRLEPLVCVKG